MLSMFTIWVLKLNIVYFICLSQSYNALNCKLVNCQLLNENEGLAKLHFKLEFCLRWFEIESIN